VIFLLVNLLLLDPMICVLGGERETERGAEGGVTAKFGRAGSGGREEAGGRRERRSRAKLAAFF
jgi:hypothetical protein